MTFRIIQVRTHIYVCIRMYLCLYVKVYLGTFFRVIITVKLADTRTLLKTTPHFARAQWVKCQSSLGFLANCMTVLSLCICKLALCGTNAEIRLQTERCLSVDVDGGCV